MGNGVFMCWITVSWLMYYTTKLRHVLLFAWFGKDNLDGCVYVD